MSVWDTAALSSLSLFSPSLSYLSLLYLSLSYLSSFSPLSFSLLPLSSLYLLPLLSLLSSLFLLPLIYLSPILSLSLSLAVRRWGPLHPSTKSPLTRFLNFCFFRLQSFFRGGYYYFVLFSLFFPFVLDNMAQ